jgi:hypothetical protein
MVRNNRGAAMPISLVVMLVLSLLGTALWQYSVNDTLHVARDQQRMQAYYLARAGADATLQAWLEAPAASRPSGVGNTVYLKDDGTFSTTDPGVAKAGQFSVTVTNNVDGSVSIVSFGDVRGLTQRVTVTLSSSFVYGHDLGWYHSSSGQMTSGVALAVATQPVIIEATSGKIKLPSSGSTVTFEGPALFFDSDLDGPFHNRLNLKAETIVFDQSAGSGIRMKQNEGKLFLYVPDGMGIVREGVAGLWGRVYFPPSVKHHKTEVLHTDGLMLGGRAFYFQKKTDGVDILNLGSGDLVEILNPIVPLPADLGRTIIWN